MIHFWTLSGKIYFKFGVFGEWRIYIDAIQQLEPFPPLGGSLAFAFAGHVVKLRIVVLPSCDVYKIYIFVNDFVSTLLLIIYKTT